MSRIPRGDHDGHTGGAARGSDDLATIQGSEAQVCWRRDLPSKNLAPQLGLNRDSWSAVLSGAFIRPFASSSVGATTSFAMAKCRPLIMRANPHLLRGDHPRRCRGESSRRCARCVEMLGVGFERRGPGAGGGALRTALERGRREPRRRLHRLFLRPARLGLTGNGFLDRLCHRAAQVRLLIDVLRVASLHSRLAGGHLQ